MKHAITATLCALIATAACESSPAATPEGNSAASSCPTPPTATIHSQGYLGAGPVYLGALATRAAGAGDLNKIPWAVAASYASVVTITGKRSDDKAIVNFGLRSPEPNIPVSFQRPDQEGLMLVYQPRLVVGVLHGSAIREGALFWSFPTTGCYLIAASGTELQERIYLRIGVS